MRDYLAKWKGFLTDTVWSVSALVLMNGVSQFIVYPVFSGHMGDEAYGNFLYLISFINIVAVAVGVSANYVRLKTSVADRTKNGDYNIVLLGAMVLGIPMTALVAHFGGVPMNATEIILFWLLNCATMFRYYSDVAFRLELNYRKYFCYYLFVSLGYLIGILLFLVTRYWALTLLVGEMSGVLYAGVKSGLYRDKPLQTSVQFRPVLIAIFYLTLSQLLVNVASNSDRTILKWLISGTAVTIYYLASLGGKMSSLVVTPLNSVIIGYLARYKGGLTKKMVFQICCALLAAVVAGTFALAGASYIFIRLIYPQNLANVAPYLLTATFPQLIFLASSVLNTVLLRFSKEQYQIVLNIVFLVVLGLLTVPAAMAWGIEGYIWGYLLATVIRFLTVLFFALNACQNADA